MAMSKKLIPVLIIFVSMYLFAPGQSTADADPNLAVWYKLDESGTTTNVPDSSTYNKHGNIETWVSGEPDPDPNWDPDGGEHGGCLSFFDETRINVPISTLDRVSTGITVSLWVKDAWRVGQNCVFDAAAGQTEPFRVTAYIGTAADAEVLWRAGNDTNDALKWDGGNVEHLDGWHHWAFVKDEDAGNMRIYLDGLPAASKTSVANSMSTLLPTELLKVAFVFRVGATSSLWNNLKAKVDDFKVHDRALSDSEVLRECYASGDEDVAWMPDPPDAAEDLCDDVVLSWTPGDSAIQHDVYFGTDEDDVENATTVSAPYRLRQGPNSYDAGALETLSPGVTYYWRIDEFDGASVYKGDVWEFIINDGNAFGPDPADGESAVLNEALLSWSPGCSAASHDVYFGTDYDLVRDASTASSEYKGNQPLAQTTYDPCDFDYLTDYYWRIDERNGPTTWKGEVWTFTSQTQIIDPNNTLWYALDETDGYTAYDSSNFMSHGVVDMPEGGPPVWVPDGGQFGGSLTFSDDTAIWVPTAVLSRVTNGIGIICWAKEPSSVLMNANGGDSQLHIAFNSSEVTWRAGDDTEDVLTWDYDGQGLPSDWHCWVFVKDEVKDSMSIYLDGELATSKTVTTSTLAGIRNKPFKVGGVTQSDNDFDGLLDDFIVYDRSLSAKEIARQLQIGGPVGKLALAWMADPQYGQVDVYRDAILSWMPGDYALEHDVYLGTDWDDVNDATTSSTGIYRGRQDPCEYDPPGDLELDTTYYWRVDEVNDPCVWKGSIWTFTVGNFLVMEDFEKYTDDYGVDPLYLTWVADIASSALIYLGVDGTDPVRTGEQSMYYMFLNNFNFGGGYYSEAGKTLGGMDFTQDGMKALTLNFYGDAGNAASATEEPYVGLDDGSSYVQVEYSPISDIQEEEWHEWNIPISDYNALVLTSIDTIYIGFGDRTGSGPQGNNGKLYIDDVRLYPPRCVPDLGPTYDWSGNCIVDLSDIGIMANEWLRADANLAVQAPAQPPVAHWELDDSGAVATDSEGSNDGSLEDDYTWVTGRVGSGAVEFAGDGGRVRVPHAAELMPNTTVSATAWIYASEDLSYSARIVTKGIDAGNWEAYFMQFNGSASWAIRDPSHTNYAVESDALSLNEWFHVGGTYDGDSVKLYINGQLDQEDSTGGLDILQDSNDLSIGNATDINDRAFIGKIDDVRVYDYALSAVEVAYVATAPAYDGYVELTAQSNIYDEESAGDKVVNFRDLAKFMTAWLEQKLWPE